MIMKQNIWNKIFTGDQVLQKKQRISVLEGELTEISLNEEQRKKI